MSTMNLRVQSSGASFSYVFSPRTYGINVACFVPRFLSVAIPAFCKLRSEDTFHTMSGNILWV